MTKLKLQEQKNFLLSFREWGHLNICFKHHPSFIHLALFVFYIKDFLGSTTDKYWTKLGVIIWKILIYDYCNTTLFSLKNKKRVIPNHEKVKGFIDLEAGHKFCRFLNWTPKNTFVDVTFCFFLFLVWTSEFCRNNFDRVGNFSIQVLILDISTSNHSQELWSEKCLWTFQSFKENLVQVQT